MNKKVKIGRSMLETITVALYEDPIIIFREYVQNSLDAYNKSIIDEKRKVITDIHVDIDIDDKAKIIFIKDNGYGISTYSVFQEKMLSIGNSEKNQDRTKYIGFRGIGRISGLAFCEKLIFRNKPKDSNKIHKCVWDGAEYRNLLDKENATDDLESILQQIVTFSEEDATGIVGNFFEVTMENYTDEINEILEDPIFKEKLIRMLPLKYNNAFKGAKKILERYYSFMNERMERFMISIKFQGVDLFKSYNDQHILGSDIIFWEIRGKPKKNGATGDKIGLLWFTFDKLLKSTDVKKDQYYGILTRSKNVLLGTNETFAVVADKSKKYVTTFREMTQALQAVYGELLINSLDLRDNSRRDWFLPDEHSYYLSSVITEFMQRLHNYRYCASRYFRDNPTKKKDELKIVLDELVNIKDNAIDYKYFYHKEKKANPRQTTTPSESNAKEFSEEDISEENPSLKKYYDLIMKIIESFLIKEKKHFLFLKLRAYITKHLSQK